MPDEETYLSYFKTKKLAKENSFDFSPADNTLNLSCFETNSKQNISKKLVNILDSTQKESVGGLSKGETVPKNLFNETGLRDSLEMSNHHISIKQKRTIEESQERNFNVIQSRYRLQSSSNDVFT